MWKMIEKEPYLRGMWEHFSCERSKAKKFRKLADEEKQAGIQGQWQQESQAREYLEQLKCSHDTDMTQTATNQTWEEEILGKKLTASECAFDRIKEAFDLVAKDEVEKISIVQEIMLRSTDYLRRIIAPVGGQRCVTMSYLCPNCNSSPPGRLCLVGLCWQKVHQLVVCDLWRNVRLEAIEQAFGRTNRRKR